MYLIAEYCENVIYMGWHLYYRDSKSFVRNKDGSWGWVRRPYENEEIIKYFLSLGISCGDKSVFNGDGSCDNDAIAEFAKRFPLKGKKCGGKVRGGIEIKKVNGEIHSVPSVAEENVPAVLPDITKRGD